MDIGRSEENCKPVRIFWFGAHKLLINTELARLRQLGFEVFNPPYLSHILDQSAVTYWDRNQQTTLPPDVFEILAGYNFFYNTIDSEITDLLNEYFDAVVVTLVARWVTEILRTFKGTVIFRTYGQTSLLSQDLKRAGAKPFILERDNFFFSPHSQETGGAEEDWLQERMTVIPYCLTDDVFDLRNTWCGGNENILISAPNILGNPFHRSHYDFVKEYFYQNYYKYVGVQPLGDLEDPQVIGTLHRSEQLDLFKRAAGYLYTYSDPRVCYLPPVEMMVFGGPVIYLAGSLLASYLGAGAPGEANTVAIARQKCERLRKKVDPVFVAELQDVQKIIVDRYDPKFVWPVFDKKMCDMLPSQVTKRQETRSSAYLFPELSPAWSKVKTYAAEVLSALASAPGTEDAVSDIALAPLIHADAYAEVKQQLADQLNAGKTILQSLRSLLPTTDGLTPAGKDLVFKPPPLHASASLGIIDRIDCLFTRGMLGVGQWVCDPIDGSRARLASAGTDGYVLFGPYITLPVGRYELQFNFRAVGGPADAIGNIDVTRNKTELFSLQIFAQDGRPQVIRYMLDVENPLDIYEFRVISNGVHDLYLYHVTLQRVAPDVLDTLNFENFLDGGGALGLGQWSFDERYERWARFAPVGSKGFMHWGPYMRLIPGQYTVQFINAADGLAGLWAARADVVGLKQRQVVAVDIFPEGGAIQRSGLTFDAEPNEEYEFRVQASGSSDFFLYAISLGNGNSAAIAAP